MMKKIARYFSYILHPLLMPLYVLLFIFNSDSIFSLTPLAIQLYCYMITIVVVLLLPLLSLFFFKRWHLIRNYSLDSRQERIYPMLVAIVAIFIGFYFVRRVPYTNIVQQLYLVLVIILSGFSMITVKWKISMHMTAVGAVSGFIILLGMRYMVYVNVALPLALLLSGILGSCRLLLEKHNPAQVYTGYLLGLCFVLVLLV